MAEKSLQLLGLARKGGNVAIGEDPVGTAAASGKARLIILAADAASHTRRRASSFGTLHNTPVIFISADKTTLGGIFGRGSVAMAALTDIRLAKAFLQTLEPSEANIQALQAVSQKADIMQQRKQKKRDRGTRRS